MTIIKKLFGLTTITKSFIKKHQFKKKLSVLQQTNNFKQLQAVKYVDFHLNLTIFVAVTNILNGVSADYLIKKVQGFCTNKID